MTSGDSVHREPASGPIWCPVEQTDRHEAAAAKVMEGLKQGKPTFELLGLNKALEAKGCAEE